MNPLKVKRRAANLSTSLLSGKSEQTDRDYECPVVVDPRQIRTNAFSFLGSTMPRAAGFTPGVHRSRDIECDLVTDIDRYLAIFSRDSAWCSERRSAG